MQQNQVPGAAVTLPGGHATPTPIVVPQGLLPFLCLSCLDGVIMVLRETAPGYQSEPYSPLANWAQSCLLGTNL